MNDLFPIFLKLKGRRALVVGGGTMAGLRTKRLVAAGARVTVISPKISAEIEELARAGSIVLLRRRFEQTDLGKDYFIVIAATNDPDVQQSVFEQAECEGILCNVVDNPKCCNFYTPAVVERGELKIAISTGARSPFLAGKLRGYMEEAIPKNAADLTQAVGLLRMKLRSEIPGNLKAQKRLINEFLERVLRK